MELANASDIGGIVKKERKAQRVTQVQLAQLSNVGVRFVRDIEDGKKSLQFDKLFRVLETLGIAVSVTTPSGE